MPPGTADLRRSLGVLTSGGKTFERETGGTDASTFGRNGTSSSSVVGCCRKQMQLINRAGAFCARNRVM